MSQTTIQKLAAVRTGSVKFEYGPDFSSLVDLGAINGFIWNHGGETVEITLDNVDDVKKLNDNDKYVLNFDMAETGFDNIAGVFSGMFTTTNIAGSLVSAAAQSVAANTYAFNQFIEITNQNGSGAVIVVNSVTGSTDGLLVAGTDYYIGQNAAGSYGIFIIGFAANVSTVDQILAINYDYTPNASVRLTPKSGGIAPTYVVQFTNTNDAGKTVTVRLENVSSINQMSMPFPGDGTDDITQISVELEGKLVYADDQQAL
jgi:hypothetical protein